MSENKKKFLSNEDISRQKIKKFFDKAEGLFKFLVGSLVILFFCWVYFSEPLSDDIKALKGKIYIAPYALTIIDKYGWPETLLGTNNQRWVAYFEKGDFTIISTKETGKIDQVLAGKRPRSGMFK